MVRKHRLGMAVSLTLFGAACADGSGDPADTDIGTDTVDTVEEPCASDPCDNGGVCTPDGDTYMCDCPAGFDGDSCENNIDECASRPCENGGACMDLVDGYACDCSAGFEGDSCEIDIDECAADPCENGGTCTDLVDAFACDCPTGFEGTSCETNHDDCSPDPCQNNGTCTDEIGAYVCDCTPGWVTSDCSVSSVKVDAAFWYPGANKYYFFRDDDYIRFDVASDQADSGYPVSISTGWPGVPYTRIDAAMENGDSEAYLFSGTEILRYDLGSDSVKGAYNISTVFPDLPFSVVEAAYVDRDADVFYLFSGTQYVQYDLGSFGVAYHNEGYPRSISGDFPGVPFTSVDEALENAHGKVYLFSGNQYVRFDIANGEADPGYPLNIIDAWSGVEFY